MSGQRADVLTSFAQGRHTDREHAEPVVKIPAEAASFYFVTEVPICRRDDAHVYMARLIITHTLEISFLQYPEQLAL